MKKTIVNMLLFLVAVVFALLISEVAVRVLNVDVIAGQTIYYPNVYYS